MKATVFARSAIALAIVSLAGCSTWDSMTKSQQATTVGAASGAVGGAVVGGPVGAVAGGAIGGVAGHEMAKSDSTSSTASRSDSTYAANRTYATNDTSTSGSRSSTSTDSSRSDSTSTTTSSTSAGMANSASTTNWSGSARSNDTGRSAQSSQPRSMAMNGQTPETGSDTTQSTSREEDIRAVQQSLNEQGYDVGSIDGVWGPKTSSAVRKFQTDHGLQASGRLDTETRTALGKSNGGASNKVSSNGTSSTEEDAKSSPSQVSSMTSK